MEALQTCLTSPAFGFFALACAFSLLLALAETAAAFPDTPWAALCNRWAWPIYGFYGLLPLLIGAVLREHDLIQYSVSHAMLLGLAGPSLLRTRVQLFQPLDGRKDGVSANLEKIIAGLHSFCHSQINRNLARSNMLAIEQATENAAITETQLLQRLRHLLPEDEMQRVTTLAEQMRAESAEQARGYLLLILGKRDPESLHQLNEG